MGRMRKYKERVGKTIVVEAPEGTWEKIEHAVDMEDGIVDSVVVQEELGISKKTLANYIACGKISKKMYTIAVNGVKKFFIYPILGLKKKVK